MGDSCWGSWGHVCLPGLKGPGGRLHHEWWRCVLVRGPDCLQELQYEQQSMFGRVSSHPQCTKPGEGLTQITGPFTFHFNQPVLHLCPCRSFVFIILLMLWFSSLHQIFMILFLTFPSRTLRWTVTGPPGYKQSYISPERILLVWPSSLAVIIFLR